MKTTAPTIQPQPRSVVAGGSPEVPRVMNGLEHPGVLDTFTHDTHADTLVLAMYENRLWEGDEAQHHQLVGKLNAYLSFILDGEMVKAYPQFVGKPVKIQLRTVCEPDEKAYALIRRIREEIALRDIGFEVIPVAADEQPQGGPGAENPSAGGGCGCG